MTFRRSVRHLDLFTLRVVGNAGQPQGFRAGSRSSTAGRPPSYFDELTLLEIHSHELSANVF
jgi:hypothetical protein